MIVGSKEEQKQLKGEYKNEIDFQLHLKNSRFEQEQRRDNIQTQHCQDLFRQQCEAAKQQEIAKRELQRRIAEENLMLAANKKRQIVADEVQTTMKAQKDIHNSKVTYSTMIR